MLIKNSYKQHLNKLSKLYEPSEAESILRILYESVFNKQFGLLLVENDNFTQEQEIFLNNYFTRLLNNEPIQYILNKAFFYGYEFYVDSNVLIPRNETEELVKLILDSEDRYSGLRILDIGTGSACIPITLKLERSNYEVSGIDISSDVLEVARINADKLGVKVEFACANILDLDSADLEKFDLIVSNPPYVLEREKSQMKMNVLNFEPETALFVPNDDPLKFYKAIIKSLPSLLKEKGRLYLEINNLCAEELSLLLKQYFNEVKVYRDFRGNERFIVGYDYKCNYNS